MSQLMWKGFARFLALSLLSTSLSLLSYVQEDSNNAHMVASLLHIFPPQTDEFWRSQCLWLLFSLMQSLFQLLFFLVLSTESCFCYLLSLHVCDRHTSCIVRVCVYVSVCEGWGKGWWGWVVDCVCVCEHFSGLEAAFMSVPSVENGSASEGQPLCCTGLPTLFPKSQMPSSDVESLLLVHETTTENIVYIWDQPSDLPLYQHVDMNRNKTKCFIAILYCH